MIRRTGLALAQSQPGELTFGSAGGGTPRHMAGELFNIMAGIRIVHVPSNGTPAAIVRMLHQETVKALDAHVVQP